MAWQAYVVSGCKTLWQLGCINLGEVEGVGLGKVGLGKGYFELGQVRGKELRLVR